MAVIPDIGGMELRTYIFELPLRRRFVISHASRTVQPTLIVELRDEKGCRGLGEATATSYYGLKVTEMRASLESLRPWLSRYQLDAPEAFYEELSARLPDQPFPRCALDVAAHDLWARRHGQALYALWGLDPTQAPTTSYTIGLAPVEEMVDKLREKPWPIYKIKLGTEHDLDIIRALRRETDAVFRIDANTAWTAEETIERSYELAELGVEFLEQPLPADDWSGHRRVFEQSALPIIADESCQTEADLPRCAGHFHGINIKLMKCGGLTPARRMIRQARSLGLKAMVGCMTESSVGISAIAQLAPLLDYVDMDGALLLARDPARGVIIDARAQLHYAPEPGTGATLVEGV